MMNSQILIINDPKLLRQMLSNLLTNARKYSPNGDPVDFELNREENQAILLIRDRGISIPPNDQNHLFQPFHRAQNTGIMHGTGLGLRTGDRQKSRGFASRDDICPKPDWHWHYIYRNFTHPKLKKIRVGTGQALSRLNVIQPFWDSQINLNRPLVRRIWS